MGRSNPRHIPRRPAETLEGRENQLVSLATNLAEKQLTEGTASAQVITHFLKLGTTREELEQEKLRHENLLLSAKRDQIESQQRLESLYGEALSAFKQYRGEPEDEQPEYDDYDY